MSAFITLATDVLIDSQRGEEAAAFELAHLARTSTLAMSTIVQIELLPGSANKQVLQSAL